MQANKTIITLIQEAQFYEERGRIREAAKKYAAVLQQKPDQFQALYGLGTCLIEQKDYDEGEKLLKRGMALYPKIDLFYDGLYVHESKFNNNKEISQILTSWLKNVPSSAIAHARKADFLMKTKHGKHEDIFQEAKEAIRLNPTHPYCNEVMAFALSKYKGKEKEAIEYFTQALKLNPHDASTHNNFGVLLLNSGDPKRALDEFRMALRLDPTMQISVDNLGAALYATNRFLAWHYKFSVFAGKHTGFAKLSGLGVFFLFKAFVFFGRDGIIPEFLAIPVALLYITYILYTFFGFRTFMFLFKKGWIR